jgi:DNA uptake protein ComE-like DNA-binding protein
VTDQEAESIVAHRDKSKFASIADLLDVELVEKVAEQPKGKPDQQGKTPRKPEDKAPEQEKTSKEPEGSSEGGAKPSEQPDKPKKAQNAKKKKPQTTVKGTGKKAFDMKKFRQIADQVTTQDEDVIKGVVNINTAPAEVLACLPGFDDALARRIVGWRRGHATGFETAADLLDVEGVSMDVFKQVCPLVSARSDVFSVRSFGVLGDGDMYCCVSAVIDRTGDTAKIGYWRELE